MDAVGGDGMSLKLFALLWLGEVGVFGIVLAPNVGRWTALSARDLNCSDQFSPSAEVGLPLLRALKSA